MHISDLGYYCSCSVIMHRKSETDNLRWKHADFNACKIRICEQLLSNVSTIILTNAVTNCTGQRVNPCV